MTEPRVLVASPVRQKPLILREFLASITRLRTCGLRLSCAFIDDNVDPESSRLLAEFAYGEECVVLPVGDGQGAYYQDEGTHHWREELIWKVAAFKDLLIQASLDSGYDYLFLADSDLVLHPCTLERLIQCDKDVVSEVFWTAWKPGEVQLPQVWARGQYELAAKRREEQLSNSEKQVRALEFMRNLYRPGLTPVGGLGACTLIRRSALNKGARFAEIDNLCYWGEDRHFCVRARSLGIELWADSTCPPLHLYRESDLQRLPDYVAWSAHDRWSEPKVTLSMVVRNEAGRYLERALIKHREFIDEAVIVDDASEDDTVAIARRCLEGVPLRLIRNDRRSFHNKVALRKQQWHETVASHPDWILNLDADEILEDDCVERLRAVASQTRFRYIGFSMYDMWDEHHYRNDNLWNAHQRSWGFMFRYTPFFDYTWQETSQHCGRFPKNLDFFELGHCSVRIQHLGWARANDRESKLRRYMELDPDGNFGSLSQYESILDPAPYLVPWSTAEANQA